MLVLERKVEQAIEIKGGAIREAIRVSVLGIERDRVKLGFRAPHDVVILREELVGTEGKPRKDKDGGGMLILTRNVGGNGVFIDGDVYLKVLGAERGRVKLGFEAPDDILILRAELTDENIEGRPQNIEGRPQNIEGRPPRSKEAR